MRLLRYFIVAVLCVCAASAQAVTSTAARASVSTAVDAFIAAYSNPSSLHACVFMGTGSTASQGTWIGEARYTSSACPPDLSAPGSGGGLAPAFTKQATYDAASLQCGSAPNLGSS